MRSKGPVVSRLDGFFANTEVLYDAPQTLNGLEDAEYQAKYLRVAEIQHVEAVAGQLCNDNKFAEKHCARLLALFAGTCGNLKVPRAPAGEGMTFRAYVHGPAWRCLLWHHPIWKRSSLGNALLQRLPYRG